MLAHKALPRSIALFLLSAGPALAECSSGAANCRTLSGNHPASQAIWLFALIFCGGLLAAVLGSMAVNQNANATERSSTDLMRLLIRLGKEPGWRLEKKLAFGGVVACFGSMAIISIIMFAFGTRA